MTYKPAPIETKMTDQGGMLADVWGFWFNSLEVGKRKNIGTGQLDATTALSNLTDVNSYGTIILEPTSVLSFYAFKGFIDGQKILIYNNGTATATIDNVTSTIAEAKGLTIQWDTTLNKWIEG